MNKKGFTLVELLAAIVVLGIIVTIVYPTVTSTIKSSKEKVHDSQVKTVEKALRMYYLDHLDHLKDLNENGTLSECGTGEKDALKVGKSVVNVSTLISEGYISDNETKDNKLIDPCTDEEMSGVVSVKWLCDKKQYQYKFEVENTCD